LSQNTIAAGNTAATPAKRDDNGTTFAILVSLSICHLLNDMNQSLVPAIYPILKEAYHLDFAQIGLIAHLFSLLVPVFGGPAAGIVMGLATVAAIAGRTLVGWLMPQGSDRRLVACLSHVVQIAGSLALLCAAGTDGVLLVAGVLLFGAGIGNTTSLPPLIAQVEFGKADVQRVVPLIVAVGQGTYAFAPAAFGWLRTLSPAEGMLVFVAAALIQAAAIALFLLGRKT